MTLQAQILALLDALQAEMGMALLFITHDLNLVRRFTHRVGVMERGRLVEKRADRAGVRRAAAPLHPKAARQPAAPAGAAGRRRRAEPDRGEGRAGQYPVPAAGAPGRFDAVRQATL